MIFYSLLLCLTRRQRSVGTASADFSGEQLTCLPSWIELKGTPKLDWGMKIRVYQPFVTSKILE